MNPFVSDIYQILDKLRMKNSAKHFTKMSVHQITTVVLSSSRWDCSSQTSLAQRRVLRVQIWQPHLRPHLAQSVHTASKLKGLSLVSNQGLYVKWQAARFTMCLDLYSLVNIMIDAVRCNAAVSAAADYRNMNIYWCSLILHTHHSCKCDVCS
jgi:hypothetical protein